MRLRPLLMLSCSLLLAACDGGGPVTASVSVTGSIGGTPMSAPKPIMFEISESGRVRAIYVVLSEADGACEALKANQSLKGKASITLKLKNGKGDTLKAGSYGVNAEQFPNVQVNYSQGSVSRLDATCTETIASANTGFTAGTVELTDYSEGTSVTGTFSVTVGGATVSGSFAANACAGVTQAMLDDADTCI